LSAIALLRGKEFPAQPWLGNIQTERIVEILATKLDNLNGTGRLDLRTHGDGQSTSEDGNESDLHASGLAGQKSDDKPVSHRRSCASLRPAGQTRPWLNQRCVWELLSAWVSGQIAPP
jgi:hypothetical protein